MKLYQPVLFVGLGGAGCAIGAELERRLREEICGPDGTEFQRMRSKADYLPYQLPSCVQFVYADMNQADLDRMPLRVVPGIQYLQSARLTAHYVRDLVPRVDSYPELARNLRLEAGRIVMPWLPPSEGEPRVNPLQRGTGQFPTIGRAALFGTFTNGISAAIRDLHTAIGKLSHSGEDLHSLGGLPPRTVDVFVAFSVAGGTGGGIFYDYLHLIGRALDQSRLRARIFPLVLMPSAFDPGMGGGRNAELNAARALLDLFFLVDSQNSGDAVQRLRSRHDREVSDPDEQAVYYPVEGRIELRPGIMPTGFLFSRPPGAEREDLHRSIASLVTWLIGSELEQEDDRTGETHQSFADSFVNAGVNRELAAENGVGRRGVSTALVASLTVPADEIAGIIAGRLLRTAIENLSAPFSAESNRSLMEEFLVKAGLQDVLDRPGSDFTEPAPGLGARGIAAALSARQAAMLVGLADLEARLDRKVPRLAARIDPRTAVGEILAATDAFRAHRVLFGYPGPADEVEQSGAVGLLHRRRVVPHVPDGRGTAPPGIPLLHDRFFGLRKLRWTDPVPTEFRSRQDEWYRWRTQVAWAESWTAHAATWRRPLEQVERQLGALIKELTEFAQEDKERFERRARDLYRRRVGVSYLLPPGGADMEHFYNLVIGRMADYQVGQGRLQANASEADLLRVIVGADGWRKAYNLVFEHSSRQAVAELLERVRMEVKTFLRTAMPGQLPLLPRMHDLLAAAAGVGTDSSLLYGYLEEFRSQLTGLVPARFAPQGNGPMRVLISYPADARNPAIAYYLEQSINLPSGTEVTYEYQPTSTESISVVMLRTSMGITDVPEVAEVLRLWASALAVPRPEDKLRWRQRTGYNFGYLTTREENRVEILHRLMCALWNGRIESDGPPESPDLIHIVLDSGMTMDLQLTPFSHASSWGSLLRAYELWTLDGSDVRRRISAQLMKELPVGLDSNVHDPATLYLVVRNLAEDQIECLDDLLGTLSASGRLRAKQMRDFWAVTMPAAVAHPFTGLEAPLGNNLLQLEAAVNHSQQ